MKPKIIKSIYPSTWQIFLSFWNIARPISAFKSLDPDSKKLATFRNLGYKNLRNFILFYFTIFILTFIGLMSPAFKDFTVEANSANSFYLIISFIKNYFFSLLPFFFGGLVSTIVYVNAHFFPIFKRIQEIKKDIQDANDVLSKLSEDDLKKLSTLKKFVIYEHTSFSEELVKYNMRVFAHMIRVVSIDKLYVFDDLEKVYTEMLKKYNRSFGMAFLKPQLILLNRKYANRVNNMVKNAISKLD
jgi:hypothetical protein